jgi:hypothetical protein
VGGSVRGNSIPVTTNPSFTSWPRITAEISSTFPPTKKVTKKAGKK